MENHTITYDEGSHKSQMAFLAFNTGVMLTLYSENGPCTESLVRAERMCREYERLFSRKIAESDIHRLNHAKGRRTYVDPRTADLIEKALGYCAESQGAFDITIAPIVELWNMKNGIIPTPDDLAKALPHVDWKQVQTGCDPHGEWAQLRDPDAAIDLGGIAKGWIADELGAFFEKDGDIEGYLIDLGGNILVGGRKPDSKPWKIRIRDAFAEFNERFEGHLEARPSNHPFDRYVVLDRGSVVTSGVYERCFARDGILYHHILDPSTGYPVRTDLLSATVVCEKSIDAEGFSTTLLAQGREKAGRTADAHPEIKRIIYQ